MVTHLCGKRNIKSKVLKINTANDTPIMLEGVALEDVEIFTCLGSIVDKQGGTVMLM